MPYPKGDNVKYNTDNPEPVEKVKLYTKEGKRYGI